MKKIVLILAAVFLAGTAQEAELPIAKITLRAIDEQGLPVQGANITISFEQPVPKWGSGVPSNVAGLTNVNGEFTASGHSFDTLGGRAEKAGFYSSWSIPFKFDRNVNGQWQPWNPTVGVMLKKIGKPEAMYARHTEAKIPVDSFPVGFDLVAADWVAPYGRGEVADFVFESNRKIVTPADFSGFLRLTFSNPTDDIASVRDAQDRGRSQLKLPREAPNTGYSREQVWSTNAGSRRRAEEKKESGYFFRVRSVVGNAGETVSALYGKLLGDVEFYIGTKAPKPGIGFTYYLNPTPNDRNVEFDPKRNLFTNLKDEERVTAP